MFNGDIATIIGTGSYLPPCEVSNEELVNVIGQKNPDWIERMTGIRSRRFLGQIDPHSGKLSEPFMSELEMAQEAARQALARANVTSDQTKLLYVTCTNEELRFNRPAIVLANMLGMPEHAFCKHLDAGCGGVAQAVDFAEYLLKGGAEYVLLVASNCPSVHIDRDRYVASDTYLSIYIFGDGAGAFLFAKDGGSKILAHYFASDPAHPLMFYHEKPGHQGFFYEIDAREVKRLYAPLMKRALDGLQGVQEFSLHNIRRYYFHQANLRIIEGFCKGIEVPMDRVSVNVDRYANLSAASTLVLFNEDVRSGRVAKGDLCLFCVVGAGAQFGAFLVEV